MTDAACPRYLAGEEAVPGVSARPALFLDRDGVINRDHGYTHRREDFEFMPGIFDLARRAAQDGWALVVVTNQAGIGRGYYSQTDFELLTRWMIRRFADESAPIERVYYCPHHPEAVPGLYRRECRCRKPAPGMIDAAGSALGLDLAASALVGDKVSDIEAGHRAGVGRLILLGTESVPPLGRPVWRAQSLLHATNQLFSGGV